MMMMTIVLMMVLMMTMKVMVVEGADAAGKVGGRGFGDFYEWYSLEAGLKESERTGRPVMMVVHKSWCSACKRLAPLFAGSSDIQSMASAFVMVNVHDDEEPQDPQYKPDGGYIPRILFIEPGGKVRTDIVNTQGNPQYKYFYTSGENVAAGMKAAVKAFKLK